MKHVIIKLLKTNNKENIRKAARGTRQDAVHTEKQEPRQTSHQRRRKPKDSARLTYGLHTGKLPFKT